IREKKGELAAYVVEDSMKCEISPSYVANRRGMSGGINQQQVVDVVRGITDVRSFLIGVEKKLPVQGGSVGGDVLQYGSLQSRNRGLGDLVRLGDTIIGRIEKDIEGRLACGRYRNQLTFHLKTSALALAL